MPFGGSWGMTPSGDTPAIGTTTSWGTSGPPLCGPAYTSSWSSGSSGEGGRARWGGGEGDQERRGRGGGPRLQRGFGTPIYAFTYTKRPRGEERAPPPP